MGIGFVIIGFVIGKTSDVVLACAGSDFAGAAREAVEWVGKIDAGMA